MKAPLVTADTRRFVVRTEGMVGETEHRFHTEIVARRHESLFAGAKMSEVAVFELVGGKFIKLKDDHHSRAELIDRNGRWGTCGFCPRRSGKVYPEECEYTTRGDHQLKPTDR